jgi:hypothetical protein
MKLQPTNLKNGKRVPVMHGENFLVPLSTVAKGKFTEYQKFTIAHSESGHSHTLVSETPFEVMDETEKHDLYVRLFEPAQLEHQKTFDIHETQVLAPGDYVVYHKTEYDPFADVVREVYD